MKAYLTLDDIDLNNRTALLRADLNVPMKDGVITNAARLERLVTTIHDISNKGGKIPKIIDREAVSV